MGTDDLIETMFFIMGYFDVESTSEQAARIVAHCAL